MGRGACVLKELRFILKITQSVEIMNSVENVRFFRMRMEREVLDSFECKNGRR